MTAWDDVGAPKCAMCSRWQAIADSAELLRSVSEKRAARLESELLAKSAAYDALVAAIAKAPVVAVAIGYANGYADTDIEIECYPEDFERIVAINGQRVRLLPDPSPAQRGEED